MLCYCNIKYDIVHHRIILIIHVSGCSVVIFHAMQKIEKGYQNEIMKTSYIIVDFRS